MCGKLRGDDGKRYARECWSYIYRSRTWNADDYRYRFRGPHPITRHYSTELRRLLVRRCVGVQTGAFTASDFQSKVI